MMRFCFDPGHGGKDPGAGANGLVEKNLTLAVVKEVQQLFLENFPDSFMTTRTQDVYLSPAERAYRANTFGIEYFISIHFNAAGSSSARGFEVFHYEGSKRGKEFAEKVSKALAERLPLKNRGAKPAHFAVLRATKMPAILIECGFLTNQQEAGWIKNNVKTIARAIYEAVCTAVGLKPYPRRRSEAEVKKTPDPDYYWVIVHASEHKAENIIRLCRELSCAAYKVRADKGDYDLSKKKEV